MLGWKNRLRTDFIVVHCSKTHPDQKDTNGHPVDSRFLYRRHREFGALMIGYHWVIHRDGVVVGHRPESIHGNHCPGANATSVGVCMIGGASVSGEPEQNFTPDQWAALHQLVESLTRKYPAAKVVGHGDVALHPTTCPSFDVKNWRAVSLHRQRKDTDEKLNQTPEPAGTRPHAPGVD